MTLFLGAEVGDRRAQPGVSQIVQRTQPPWCEAASELVFALGAGIEALQPMGQTILDALVITRLEVQTVGQYLTSPVAPIKGTATLQIERGSYRLVTQAGLYQQQRLRQATVQAPKEIEIEVRVATALQVGDLVAVEEVRQCLLVDLLPGQPLQGQPLFRHAAAFTADRLASL